MARAQALKILVGKFREALDLDPAENRGSRVAVDLTVSLLKREPEAQRAASSPRHGSDAVEVLRTRGEAENLSAVRPYRALNEPRVLVLGEDEFAAVEVFVQVEDRRVVSPDVCGTLAYARAGIVRQAIVCVDSVAEIFAMRR